MRRGANTAKRSRVRVTGIVQGVGYRPFVYALAERLGVTGHVGNDSDGVFIEAEADPATLETFVAALRSDAPPLAVVDDVRSTAVQPRGETVFTITASHTASIAAALVTPDTATCADCLRELADPRDRRYGYAFTNCTNCGPRFTITRAVPYDRPNTTMCTFTMCPRCAAEYRDPRDRRFHAQPVCCPRCGPSLRLLHADGSPLDGDPVRHAAELLTDGAVLAVKGLGGYHLAAAAADDDAVSALRAGKHREDKPFAVMVPDLNAAHSLCEVSAAAQEVLTDRRRPIVLLPRRGNAPVATAVAPGNRELGLMLPYTPVHHLLVRAFGAAFVLTSGNVSDEPIAYRDEDALARLAGIADAFLVHDRPIHMRTDDSLVRLVDAAPVLLRRSRGYVPAPLRLPVSASRPVLGCGAELKSTFALARNEQAFVSHHIGDLENAETLRSYTAGIAHFQELFDIHPQILAHDLHPEYLSSKYARSVQDSGSVGDVDLIGVQHHHAHIASCLADNAVAGPVIGVACDGTGFGPDGVLWGGEVLVADLKAYERVAHLAEVPLPGGVTALRQPWRSAVAYLHTIFGSDMPELDVLRRHEHQWNAVARLAASSLPPRTTSAGRLFDAVAALVGVRDVVNYEGQAAIELEQRAWTGEHAGYPMRCEAGLLHGADLVAAVVSDLAAGAEIGLIAARFHAGLAAGLATAVAAARDRSGLRTVALSGGVFQNMLLLRALRDRLHADGFEVLVHRNVPPNDGGISLGQAAVAAASTVTG